MQKPRGAGVPARDAVPGACKRLPALCCFGCVCNGVQPLRAKLEGTPLDSLCVAKTDAGMRAEKRCPQEQFSRQWRGAHAQKVFPGHDQRQRKRDGFLLVIRVHLFGIC